MSLELSKKALAVKPSSTLEITAKAKEMKARGIDVVGFGAGEPDFNTPQNIREAAKRAIDEGFTKYTPASGTNDLKQAISEKFKRENNISYAPDQIVISNGGKHALTNIFTAILNPGDEVIIPAPYWLSYPEIVKLAEGVPVYVRCDKSAGYKLSPEALRAAVTDKTKALILNSPSNPTGAMYTKEELEGIASVAVEKDFYVVSDEIYEHLTYTDLKHISIASLNDEIYKRTITMNGVSKSYAMTGWRIGYTGSSKEIAKVMGSVQSHQTSNPSSISQAAALEAISGPQDGMFEMLKAFSERHKYICERAAAIDGLSFAEPSGAFYVFIDANGLIGKTYKGKVLNDASDIASALITDYQTAVIPCADFGFPDHFRLSYAISLETIGKGMDRIEAFCKEVLKGD